MGMLAQTHCNIGFSAHCTLSSAQFQFLIVLVLMVLTLIGLVVVEYGSLAVGCMAVNYGPFLLTIVDQMLTLDSFNPRVHAQNTCKSTGFAQIHWIWWHSGILAFLPPATARHQ